MEYFEEWNRPRMANFVGVMMANEYLLGKNLPKAQALYRRSLNMYEKECWTILVDEIKYKLSTINMENE